MRTTLDIEDALLRKAKSFAAQAHISLTGLIEESLSLHMRAAQTATTSKVRPRLPVYAGRGGLQPTIRDALSQRALLDAADESDIAR